jgi:glycosyltransferase involved in cell wall biosynthesis
MAKVSVCIPSYNSANFIVYTIQSVLNSVYQNFEIIVNDDASTDNTRGVVESFKDSRISFFQNEFNVGTVKNWNLAIKKSTGEYAGLLNHDDLYGPLWLHVAVHQLDKQPHIGWAATAYRVIDAAGKIIETVRRFSEAGEITITDAFLNIAQLYGLGPGFIARRTILDEAGFYDETAGPSADNDLFLRLSVRYPLYYFGTYPHTAWRLHAANLTHRWGAEDQILSSLKMLIKIFADSSTPQYLQQYKESCFNFLHQKAQNFAEGYRERNDLDTYCRIIEILRSNGYKG